MEAHRQEIIRGELVVFFENECHLVWGDLCGYVWGKRDERIEVPITNERLKQTYYGAVDLYTQRCLIQPTEKGNSEGTIAFLTYLLAQCPNSRIALIWDGATYHRSQAVKDYLESVNQGLDESNWKITCIRFAPNDPKQNPIEDVWLQAKRFIREYYHLCQSFDAVKVLFEFVTHPAVSPSAEYFLWSIGRSLLDSLGRKRIKQLTLFGKHDSFYDIENREAVPERFTRDFEKILKETNKQFVIAFDEIELMAPPSVIRGSNWQPHDFVRAWRVLRAISQENPGRIAFLITGTNPKIIEEISIGESDNPIYNFFEKRYLSPFDIKDSESLLVDIGAIIGLEWPSDSIKLVHERTGGHPLLLRAYGSVIHIARKAQTHKKIVKTSDVLDNLETFLRRVEPEISQMVDVLSKYYENEFLILETLAKVRISEFREYASLFPNDISHLKGYGIIDLKENGCHIKAEPL